MMCAIMLSVPTVSAPPILPDEDPYTNTIVLELFWIHTRVVIIPSELHKYKEPWSSHVANTRILLTSDFFYNTVFSIISLLPNEGNMHISHYLYKPLHQLPTALMFDINAASWSHAHHRPYTKRNSMLTYT